MQGLFLKQENIKSDIFQLTGPCDSGESSAKVVTPEPSEVKGEVNVTAAAEDKVEEETAKSESSMDSSPKPSHQPQQPSSSDDESANLLHSQEPESVKENKGLEKDEGSDMRAEDEKQGAPDESGE